MALLTVGVIHLPRSQVHARAPAAGHAAAAAAASPEILHSGHNYTAAGLGPDGAALVGGAAPGPPRGRSRSRCGRDGAAAATSAAAAAAATSAAPLPALPPHRRRPHLGAASRGVRRRDLGGCRPGQAAGQRRRRAQRQPPARQRAPAPPAPAATTDALGALRAPDAAQRCIALLLQSTVTPLVIDFATFDGKPAVIGVVPDPQDPTKLAVIAVGPPGCSLYSLNYVHEALSPPASRCGGNPATLDSVSALCRRPTRTAQRPPPPKTDRGPS